VFVIGNNKGPKQNFARVFRFIDQRNFDIRAHLTDVRKKGQESKCLVVVVKRKKNQNQRQQQQQQMLGIENVVMTRPVQEGQPHSCVVRAKRVRLDRHRATTIVAIGSTVHVFDTD
jgi:uncharacterized radical SAM superfamily Fe-S cluster-containing enzyme